MTGPPEPGVTDPLARIAEAVRGIIPGPGADQLLAQIAAILASTVPDDVERVALENVQLQHELELLQSVDTLTGLRNRQRFFEDLRRELAAARRYDSPSRSSSSTSTASAPSTRRVATTRATGCC